VFYSYYIQECTILEPEAQIDRHMDMHPPLPKGKEHNKVRDD